MKKNDTLIEPVYEDNGYGYSEEKKYELLNKSELKGDLWFTLCERSKVDASYGDSLDENSTTTGFENDLFEISPYDWSKENDDSGMPHNFHYKPTGFKIWWYKYAFRGAETNHQISVEEILEILKKCIDYMDN